LAQALSIKSDRKIEISVPQRGAKRDVIEHALANAREALGRKLAEAASQQRLLAALAASFGLAAPPRRLEVYDNSHIQGANAVGAMIVAGPEGLLKNQYRQFNIKSTDITPGDDFAMMREVLTRRFKRLINESPRANPSEHEPEITDQAAHDRSLDNSPASEDKGAEQPWPDLVLIDGGEGQLRAVRQTLAELGIVDVPLVGIAKGPDRDAGRETFYMAGREPFRLPPRDPVLYFVQRLRDEAHRFAIGSHRQRRNRDIREAGLQEIAGIGPTRKRALLRHFGTLKAIERASISDLSQVPGVSAEPARRIYDFFHRTAH